MTTDHDLPTIGLLENEPTDGAPATLGELRSDLGGLPLTAVDVDADVVGLFATVRMVQTFHNPHAQPIEAVYVFPLPTAARCTCVSPSSAAGASRHSSRNARRRATSTSPRSTGKRARARRGGPAGGIHHQRRQPPRRRGRDRSRWSCRWRSRSTAMRSRSASRSSSRRGTCPATRSTAAAPATASPTTPTRSRTCCVSHRRNSSTPRGPERVCHGTHRRRRPRRARHLELAARRACRARARPDTARAAARRRCPRRSASRPRRGGALPPRLEPEGLPRSWPATIATASSWSVPSRPWPVPPARVTSRSCSTARVRWPAGRWWPRGARRNASSSRSRPRTACGRQGSTRSWNTRR